MQGDRLDALTTACGGQFRNVTRFAFARYAPFCPSLSFRKVDTEYCGKSRKSMPLMLGVRQHMFGRLVLAAVTSVLLVGCWPARFTERPGITGTVISAADGSPVAGASVRLILPPNSQESTFTVTTGREGRFEVEPVGRWGMYVVLGEGWPLQGSVEIEAPGFKPRRLEISWRQTRPRTRDVGVVKLALDE